MKEALFALTLAGALTAPVAEAAAKVVYDLHETTFGMAGFEGTLTVPDFISADTTFPITDFSVSNNPLPYIKAEFSPSSSSPLCSDFSLSSCDLIALSSSTGFSFYGFTPGIFSKTGINTSTNGDFSMTLTVSQTAAVPQLSTWAMMLLGFAGLGFAGWRAAHKSATLAG